MATDLTVFPIPTKEKIVRGLSWLAIGAFAVAGTNSALPWVTLAFNNLFAFGVSLSKLAILAGVIGAGGLLAVGLIPAIKTAINTFSYRALAFLWNRYPLEQMHLFHQSFLDGIEDDKEAKAKLEGIEETNAQKVSDMQVRIDTLTDAVKDARISEETRQASYDELASKTEEIKPYQGILDMIRPVIATAEQSIRVQERAAKGIERDIAVQTAKFEASEQMEVIAGIWGKNFAKNTLLRRNSEAARDVVFKRFGAAAGQIKDMRGQMEVMIKAAMVQDEINAAAARRQVEASLNVIDVPAEAVEVLDNPVADMQHRLSGKSRSFLNV